MGVTKHDSHMSNYDYDNQVPNMVECNHIQVFRKNAALKKFLIIYQKRAAMDFFNKITVPSSFMETDFIAGIFW